MTVGTAATASIAETTVTAASGESLYNLGVGQIAYDITCSATSPSFYRECG